MTSAPPSLLLRKRAMLENLLACPTCLGRLRSEPDGYLCTRCKQSFPVRNGIPRFVGELSKGAQQVKSSFNLEHSRYRDSQYLHFTPRLVQQWLDDIQLQADFFKGKLVLDAGCGSGRWSYAMASLGATIVAVDLTEAGVEVTHEATAHMDQIVVLQADLFHLPFRPNSFDFVVCWGVLHHTADPRAAFDRVAPLVKNGGQLYIMVYEKHNPLKFICTNLIRRVLRRLPEDRRYQACRSLIIRNPRLYALLSHLIICAPQPVSGDPLEISTLQLGLYDAYSPVFNHLHTRGEVAEWFRESGFTDLTLTKPVKQTNRFKAFLFGECDGSINMRGVRL